MCNDFTIRNDAGWQKVREAASLIAKDLIDSDDPKHTLFCREIAFVAIYVLFGDDISIF